ncbi:MAG: hypothetical protein K940chlam9_01216 [Chlamydiae bacterium]|nr:hypothetical protein [Chlamydiota bacterium]
MSVARNIAQILQEIEEAARQANREGSEISLLTVSKGRPLEEIGEAYKAGCRDFGENRVLEAIEKMEKAPSGIRWHYIGKLQKNKVQKVLGRFVLIHSVDTPELAEKIAKASFERGLETALLLETNASGEESKSGMSPFAWEKIFPHLLSLRGIRIEGVMTMAPLTEDEGEIRACFSSARHLFEALQERGGEQITTLSMGMSHDFPLAIAEGSTIIRIGTSLFVTTQVAT